MARTHLDRKNVALAGTIYRLRQAIDVYRVIGLNAGKAKQLGLSGAFFGYVQAVSLDMVVLAICKIFEYEKPKNPKNLKEHRQTVSVHGVVARLAKHKYTAVQVKKVERFGLKYSNTTPCTDSTQFLIDTISQFKLAHRPALVRLRDYRNERVAHQQFGGERTKFKSLPPIEEFEAVFDFAKDFYALISDCLLNVGPASFDVRTRMGLVRTFKALGIDDAQFDFPPQDAPSKKRTP
jgi:hypothetical protein